jgi:hypothetical protein
MVQSQATARRHLDASRDLRESSGDEVLNWTPWIIRHSCWGPPTPNLPSFRYEFEAAVDAKNRKRQDQQSGAGRMRQWEAL